MYKCTYAHLPNSVIYVGILGYITHLSPEHRRSAVQWCTRQSNGDNLKTSDYVDHSCPLYILRRVRQCIEGFFPGIFSDKPPKFYQVAINTDKANFFPGLSATSYCSVNKNSRPVSKDDGFLQIGWPCLSMLQLLSLPKYVSVSCEGVLLVVHVAVNGECGC